MKRSKLKNIVNKSKGFSNSIVGESPFDLFKKSFPKNINLNDNYRLEAAWEAYDKPRNFKEAIWEGLIQPIDENNYAFPSIGYNTKTDEYEYLNPGKENDIISKDIRVWDNDVIPLVKELKQGGYVRKFNEEKNCWTYTKNIQQETPVGLDNNGILEESSGEINFFLNGGKPKKVKSDLSYYDKETDTIYYSGDNRKSRKEAYNHEYFHARPDNGLLEYLKPYYENLDDEKISKMGGDLEYVKRFNNDPNHFYNPEELGARVAAAAYRTRNALSYSPEFFAKLRKDENKYGDNMRDLLHMYNDENLSKIFKYIDDLRPSVGFFGIGEGREYFDPTGEFAGGQLLRKIGINENGDLEFVDASGNIFVNPTGELEVFKQGGQMNVIPDGALHARKNNMELAKEGEVTHKGIPVIDNDGQQIAEVEKEEWTITKDFTEDVEKWYKEYFSDDLTSALKDELAIKCGKRICKELLHNTDDRANLIESMEENL